MKRIVLSMVAVLMAVCLTAAPRSISDAQAAAAKFLTAGAKSGLMKAPAASQLKLAHTQLHAEQPAFYVFNNDNGGFVLVSADDNAREILGFSETGAFNEADMPDNMRVWFQHYAEEVAWAAEHPAKANKQAVKRTYTPVAPLLKSTWSQEKPYNNLCPIDQTDNTRSYTGCVATAAAQIMYYHKHPITGTGTHTDNWDNSGKYSDNVGKGHGAETVDFGATTYDWDNMLDSYSGSYTNAQAKAVATLMYHAGVSCDMTYGGDKVGGSGAFTSSMAYALYTYFKYDKGLRYIMMDNIGYNKFEEYFLAELAAKRPILMGGATKKNEGHEFVCDGIDAEGYFHINWGWGGMSDNYFALSALDPDQQGAGGAASGEGFSIQVEAVIGIQPDKGNPFAAPLVDIEYDEEGTYDYKFSKTAAKKNETISFSTELAYNSGPADVDNAPVRFAAYKTDSSALVGVFGSDKFSMEALGNEYKELKLSASFDGLAVGDYLFAIVFRMSDTQEWTPIAFMGEGEYRPLHVTADSVYIGTPEKQGGQGGGQGGELDVDYAEASYDPSYSETPWSLILTDYYTDEPLINFYFKNVKTKIAGTYNIGNSYAIVRLHKNDTKKDYIYSETGTLKIKCTDETAYGMSPVYEISATFTGDDNNEYSVYLKTDVYAYDQNDNDIELQDTPDEQGIEDVQVQRTNILKIFRNGVLLIETDNATFDLRGARQ